MMKISFLLAQIAFVPTLVIAQSCFFPNGTAVTNPEVVPCGSNPVRTICCHSNRTNKPGGDRQDPSQNTADECLPNGLCENRSVFTEDDGTRRNVLTHWLQYCTERDVKGGKCLDICREFRGSGGTARMTSCDGTNNSTRWCCGGSNACCTNNINVIELPQSFIGYIDDEPVNSTTPTPSATPSPTPTPTPTSTPTTTNSAPPPSSQLAPAGSGGLSAGEKAGIALGVILGIILVLGACFFFRKVYRWRQDSRYAKPAEMDFSGTVYPPGYGMAEKYHHEIYPPSPTPVVSLPHELPSDHVTELPSEQTDPVEIQSKSPAHS